MGQYGQFPVEVRYAVCWLPSFAAVICIVSMLQWMWMSIHCWTLFTWLRDRYATFKLLLLLLLLSKHWFQWLLTTLQEYFTQLSSMKPVIKSVNVVWNTNVLSCWRNVSSDRKALRPTWHGFAIFMVLVVQISETWQLFKWCWLQLLQLCLSGYESCRKVWNFCSIRWKVWRRLSGLSWFLK